MTTAKVQILPLRRAYAPGKSKPCKDKSPKSAKSSGNDSSDSNDAHVTTAKRARASKPKVRSGCSTCKIRRIKCDETKPACVKCTSTGRTCDGYPSPPPRKNRASASVDQWPEPTRGLAMFPVVATPSEIRALEYFCLKTAPNLGMHFDADFWNRVVIPASVAEPALRHAMVAVGIFAEQRELIDIQNLALGATAERSAPIPSFPLQRTQDRSDLVALSNYNKSIGLLTKLVSSSAEMVDLILLACILFVCVELLRGDEVAAIRHFTGGMTILVDNLSNSQGSSSSRPMMNRVKNSIMPAFNRLEMLYALFGNSASWQYSVRLPASVPDTFASVGQARDSMVHLMNLSLRFIQSIEFLEYEPFAIPASAYDAQAALLTHLQLWQTRFTAYKSRCTTTMTPDDAYAANVLEIQRIVAYTWLSTSMTAFQCAHDVHIPNYKTAVILAEQLSKIASMRTKIVGKAVTFLLDVEIVGPLYYVCVKCREPTVRRRAIAVMRGLSRREGIWDSRILAAIAERVVAVEELDMVDGGLPSEQARIHNIPFANETNFSPEGYLTMWYRKPSGVYGDWSRWEEHVKLDARPAYPLTTDLLA